ncbi:hypothetical protein JCM8208_005221 [Rhodotorula glutinis]
MIAAPPLPSLLPAYTDSDDNLIVSYLQLGRSLDDVAAALGRSRKSVARRVAKRRADWTRDGRLEHSTPPTQAPPVVQPQQLAAVTASSAPTASVDVVQPTPSSTSRTSTAPGDLAGPAPSLANSSTAATSTSTSTHPVAVSLTAPLAPRKRPAPTPDSSSQPTVKHRRIESPSSSPQHVALGRADKDAPIEGPPTRPRWRPLPPLSGSRHARVLKALRGLREPLGEERSGEKGADEG